MIESPHQAKAAYRLLDCPAVTHEAVLGGHVQQVREVLRQAGVYLLIEDSTTLGYAGLKQAEGLGPIGEACTRGFWLHSTLAVRWDESADQGQVLGLAAQRAWARPAERPAGRRPSSGRGKEPNQVRQKRKDRESSRWACMLADLPPASDQNRCIYVADRESDIYEVFQKCQRQGISYVIRATYPRALAGELNGLDLMSAAGQGRQLGVIEVDLPRQKRTARLAVRSVSVELRGPPRPGGRPENHRLNVVQVSEMDAPAGCEAVGWTLLTDLPVETLEQCRRVIAIYRCRWLIEEFHKALKTGLKIEHSQLSDYRRLSALAGMVSVVAVFLLQAKWSARTHGREELDESKVDATLLKVLSRVHPPKGKPTRQWFWISIARLGGFLARKGDGSPGWLTLWRGWQTLQLLVRGYNLNTS